MYHSTDDSSSVIPVLKGLVCHGNGGLEWLAVSQKC